MRCLQEMYVPCKEKPPLGVEPQRIFLENRLHSLTEAIQRYLEAQTTPIPKEWVSEWNNLLRELQ